MKVILLPFAIFATCCAAQLWYGQKVSTVLKQRRPEIHRQMSGLFYSNRLFWFALFRRDRPLGDLDLTKSTERLSLILRVGLLAWLVFAAMLLSGMT